LFCQGKNPPNKSERRNVRFLSFKEYTESGVSHLGLMRSSFLGEILISKMFPSFFFFLTVHKVAILIEGVERSAIHNGFCRLRPIFSAVVLPLHRLFRRERNSVERLFLAFQKKIYLAYFL
jgi:hypothetical protein